MRDSVSQMVSSLQARGVIFQMVEERLRYRAPRGLINAETKRILTESSELVEAILNPDLTLPDVLTIPASTPNTVDAIANCIDSQRSRRAA